MARRPTAQPPRDDRRLVALIGDFLADPAVLLLHRREQWRRWVHRVVGAKRRVARAQQTGDPQVQALLTQSLNPLLAQLDDLLLRDDARATAWDTGREPVPVFIEAGVQMASLDLMLARLTTVQAEAQVRPFRQGRRAGHVPWHAVVDALARQYPTAAFQAIWQHLDHLSQARRRKHPIIDSIVSTKNPEICAADCPAGAHLHYVATDGTIRAIPRKSVQNYFLARRRQ